MSIDETNCILHMKGPEAKEFLRSDGSHTFGNCWTKFEYRALSLLYLFEDGFFLYLVFYISCSAVGLFIDPIYLCFLLLDSIIRIPTLQNVIASVTVNATTLIMTMVLVCVVF